MPKELNFFDTNLLGSLRKALPIWDRNLYVSLCIEVLHDQHRAEPVVVVRVAVSNVWIQHTSIAAVVTIATAFDKRFSQNSLIPNLYKCYYEIYFKIRVLRTHFFIIYLAYLKFSISNMLSIWIVFTF